MNPGKENTKDKENVEELKQSKSEETQHVEIAKDEAEKDIETDPEFSSHSPNDDLDEGESARLGEGKNNLI